MGAQLAMNTFYLGRKCKSDLFPRFPEQPKESQQPSLKASPTEKAPSKEYLSLVMASNG